MHTIAGGTHMQSALLTHLASAASRLQRACIAMLILGAASTSHADLPQSMDLIPNDALIAIGTKPFNVLDTELSQLMVGAEITTLSNLGQVLRIVGLDQGFDQERGLAFALLQNPYTEERPIKDSVAADSTSATDDEQPHDNALGFVVLVPVSPDGKLLKSLSPTPTDVPDVLAFTFAGEDYLARLINPSVLAIGTQTWAMQTAFAEGNNASRNASVNTRAHDRVLASDVVMHMGASAQALITTYLDDFTEVIGFPMEATKANDAADSTPDEVLNREHAANTLSEALQPILSQSDTLTVAIDAAPLGLRVDVLVSLDPESDSAAGTSELVSPEPPIRLLHASDELLGAFAADTRSQLSSSFIAAMFPELDPAHIPDGVALGVYRSNRLPIDPVDAVLRWKGDSADQISHALRAATLDRFTFTPNQHEYGSDALDGWRITPDPNTRFTLPYQGMSGPVPLGAAFTLSSSRDFARAVATHNPLESSGVEQILFGLPLLRQQLPEGAAIEMYVNMKEVFQISFIQPFLMSSGFEPIFPDALPPLAAGVAFRDNSVHAGLFISTQNIKNLFELYQASQ